MSPVYNTTDTGADDFDLDGSQLWRDSGAVGQLFIGTNDRQIAGFNLVIPTLNNATTNFTSATLTIEAATSIGLDGISQDLVLYAYANPSHAALAVGQARSTDAQIDMGRFTIPSGMTTSTITLDPVLLNSLFRNAAYTTGIAVFTLEGEGFGLGASLGIHGVDSSGTAPFITTTEHPQFTGWLDSQSSSNRNTVDDRFGMPISSHNRVGDGFNPGIAVRPDDVDPPEDKASHIPSPLEHSSSDEPLY